MKTDKLKQLIKNVIKEEVSKQVREEVKNVIEQMLLNFRNKTDDTVEKNYKTFVPTKRKPLVIKTNNQKLNEALAETIENYVPLPRNTENLVSIDGEFEKVGVSEKIYDNSPGLENSNLVTDKNKAITKIDVIKSMISENAQSTNSPSVLDNMSELPEFMIGVLKNSKKVIKKMEEQDKNGKPGLINPGLII